MYRSQKLRGPEDFSLLSLCATLRFLRVTLCNFRSEDEMAASLNMAAVLAAWRLIRPAIRHTPLIYSHYLSQVSGASIWLKPENQQPTGSFKIRGALNKIGLFTAEEKGRGIVAASAEKPP